MFCQRQCKEPTRNDPANFLLTCRGCSKTWHHRCLMPPMEDQDLIQLIRATTSGDKENDISSWMCRRCKKRPSGTPSAMSSREPTASSESRHDSKSRSPAISDTASVVSTRVKQESSTIVDTRLVNDRERNKTNDRKVTEVAPRGNLGAQRTMPSAANQPHVQPRPGPSQWRSATDVQMTGATPAEFAPREKKTSLQRPSSPTHSNQVTGKAARKFGSAVSTTSAEEDDVEMQVDSPNFSESTSRAMSRASGPPSSIRSESIAEPPPHARATSSTNEREVRPVKQVVAEDDDDSDDLYGPPVQRQIIRILPSLAEELREQQRRVAAEKEKRRAPLAPDWILAKHVNDPLWKEIPTQGRKRRKPTARKLGDNGLNVNVNELMGCFTVQNWVREHKT